MFPSIAMIAKTHVETDPRERGCFGFADKGHTTQLAAFTATFCELLLWARWFAL